MSLTVEKTYGDRGYSLIELLTVMMMLGVVLTIAVPVFSRFAPDYKLKSAARDLYSNMQLAKMGAVKNNANWAIVFDSSVSPGRYFICSDRGADGLWNGPAAMGHDDTAERAVSFADYGTNAATYGHGSATNDIPGSGSAPADSISFSNDVLVFTSRGLCEEGGYIYLENGKDNAYGLGTLTTGVIVLRKWTGSSWE